MKTTSVLVHQKDTLRQMKLNAGYIVLGRTQDQKDDLDHWNVDGEKDEDEHQFMNEDSRKADELQTRFVDLENEDFNGPFLLSPDINIVNRRFSNER